MGRRLERATRYATIAAAAIDVVTTAYLFADNRSTKAERKVQDRIAHTIYVASVFLEPTTHQIPDPKTGKVIYRVRHGPVLGLSYEPLESAVKQIRRTGGDPKDVELIIRDLPKGYPANELHDRSLASRRPFEAKSQDLQDRININRAGEAVGVANVGLFARHRHRAMRRRKERASRNMTAAA